MYATLLQVKVKGTQGGRYQVERRVIQTRTILL